MEIPPRSWQEGPVSLGCQHCELSILAAFVGILVESWENMSQGLLLWCQFKSTSSNLFYSFTYFFVHLLIQSTNIYRAPKMCWVLYRAPGIKRQIEVSPCSRKGLTVLWKMQIHNYNINARAVYNAETCLNQRG